MGHYRLLKEINLSIVKNIFTCFEGSFSVLCISTAWICAQEPFEIEFLPLGLELFSYCLLGLTSFIWSVFLGIAGFKVGVQSTLVLLSGDMPSFK